MSLGGWGPAARTERHEALEELTTAMRRLIEASVATGHDVAVLRALADEVHAVAGKLESEVDDDPWTARSSGGVADPGGLMGINTGIGRCNPTGPIVRLDVTPGATQLSGTVRFGLADVGPPYRGHGGLVASAFDQILGFATIAAGTPGMTASMTVKYRRATPLHEDVRVEASCTSAQGRRSHARGRFLDAEGNVTAEAEATFVLPRDRA